MKRGRRSVSGSGACLALGAGFGLCVPISQESEGGTEAPGSTKTSAAVGEMSKRQAAPQRTSNGPKWSWLHQAPPHRPLEASRAWLRSTLRDLRRQRNLWKRKPALAAMRHEVTYVNHRLLEHG